MGKLYNFVCEYQTLSHQAGTLRNREITHQAEGFMVEPKSMSFGDKSSQDGDQKAINESSLSKWLMGVNIKLTFSLYS